VNGHVIETSLGYFINPLVTVVMGVIILRERLRPVQWAAVGLAATAVLILTVDYGRPPWIALVLAFSFGMYGLIKKKVSVGAMEIKGTSMTNLLCTSLVVLLVLDSIEIGKFSLDWLRLDLLLVGAGVIKVIPLLFFRAAEIRIPLTTLGLLQYLAAIIQF